MRLKHGSGLVRWAAVTAQPTTRSAPRPAPEAPLPRGTLRLACAADAASIAAIYAPNVSDRAISFELDPPSARQFEERIERVQEYAPWLVCEIAGTVAGYAYASRHHERLAYQWSIDCAIYVDVARRRRGVARALYTTLFALSGVQGYHAVHAGITLPNAASVGLHESFGFKAIGVYPRVGYKLGAWHDVGWWQLELRERNSAPLEPSTPDGARQSEPEAWARAFAAGEQLLGAGV